MIKYESPLDFLRATLAGGLRAYLADIETSEDYQRRQFDLRSTQMLTDKSLMRDMLAAQRAGVDRRIRELDKEIHDIEMTRKLYFEVMGGGPPTFRRDGQPSRTFSAETRQRMSEAQKAAWILRKSHNIEP